MKNDVDPDSTGIVDFPEFISLMARRHNDIDPAEELMDALKVILAEDKNLTKNTLRHFVRTYGEKFTEEEAD